MQSQTARPPEASTTHSLQTGEEFLESLRDGREIWIYGERVDDITTHPAFRNAARSLAALYDALHDPASADVMTTETDTGNGGRTHPFFKVARSKDDLRRSAAAIEHWQRMGLGWMGRTPDYKASFISAFGADPEYFGEFAPNARRWYREAQERVLHVGHAIVNPPVDRHTGEQHSDDVFVHVERETDNGLIISGAKVVATGSPTTQYVYVGRQGAPTTNKAHALVFIAPLTGKGIKLIARGSYENAAARTGSPFDYPLSSRLDENDSVLVFDQALIPWENVLIHDVDRSNNFDFGSGAPARAIFQSNVRLSVKFDFLIGALSKALDVTGAGEFRGVQAGLGEIIASKRIIDAVRDGMIESATPGWGDSINPAAIYGTSYAALAPHLWRRAREIVENVVASGLIYLNSNAIDFQVPELRPVLDRYLRGSNGLTAVDRSKTMKLLWDAIGSEFGGRHQLYENSYFAQPEANHLRTYFASKADGTLDHSRAFVEGAMADYDLDGWTRPDLITPSDVNPLVRP